MHWDTRDAEWPDGAAKSHEARRTRVRFGCYATPSTVEPHWSAGDRKQMLVKAEGGLLV